MTQTVEIQPPFKVDIISNENGTFVVRLELGPLPEESVAKLVADRLIDLITGGDNSLSTRFDTSTPN